MTTMMPPTEGRRLYFPKVRQAVWERFPLPRPAELQPDQVLLRAVASAVSAGTEIAVYSGTHITYSLASTTQAGQPRPMSGVPSRPGYAFAGTVEAVGNAVTAVKPGDRVGCAVGHADWAVVRETGQDPAKPQREPSLILIPEGVTFEQAALGRLYTIPMVGIRHAEIRLGERVAVFGQGLIGQLAGQLALANGAGTLIAVDLWDHRLAVAQRHGATHIVNAEREDAVAAIYDATDGEGADVVIEATGHPPVINDALRAAALRGRVVLVGSPRGRVDIDPYTDIHKKAVVVIGAHASAVTQARNYSDRWTTLENYRLSVELLRQGRLHTEGLISHRVPADEALGIHAALAARPQEHLGVLIQWAAA